MEPYIFPIKNAILTFPLIALVFTLPFLFYQYGKHRYIHKLRAVLLYSFLLYLLTSYYLVILPLPKTFDTCSLQSIYTKHYQLIPFSFVEEFLRKTKVVFNEPSTYIYALRESTFLQAVFNGILLTPFGIYLRYYFKKGLKKTIVFSFLLSLFFEVTQITGLYGIYNCPYRLFDVDDLILNTFAGFLGYLIAPIFTYFLPDTGKLDEEVNLAELPVGFFRRFLALVIDWMVLGGSLYFLPSSGKVWVSALFIGLYFIVGVYLTNGKTIGKSILKIKLQGAGEKLTFTEVFTRYSILYYGVIGLNYLFLQGIRLNPYPYYSIILFLVWFSFDFTLLLHMFLHVFKKDKQLFYEKISETKVVIMTE